MMTLVSMTTLLLLLLGLLTYQSNAALVNLVKQSQDSSSSNNNNNNNDVAAVPRSLRAAAAVSCPTGANYRYISRNSTCVINYICVKGREPLKIPGCGCVCRTIINTNTNTTGLPPINPPPTKQPPTKPPTKPPVCPPASSSVIYRTRNGTCVVNFRCLNGFESFRIIGCGCGCHRVPVTPQPPNTTTTCPSGPDYRYLSRNSSCVVNYLCVKGRVPFRIPGCGCGCKTAVAPAPTTATTKAPTKVVVKPTKPPTKVVVTPTKAPIKTIPCPTDVIYKTRNTTCVIHFQCIKNYQAVKVAGCGCGCRPIPKAPTKPVPTTLKPAVQFNQPTSVPK